MTDREKLIDLLMDFRIVETIGKHVDMRGAMEQCADHLIANGVTVREPNRPLKLHEVRKHFRQEDSSVLWIEDKQESSNNGWDKNDAVFYWLNVSACRRYMTDEYGKTWRCWAEKPAEEERTAAEWEK